MTLYEKGQGELARDEAVLSRDNELAGKLSSFHETLRLANGAMAGRELNTATIQFDRALDLDQQLANGRGSYRLKISKSLSSIWVQVAGFENKRDNPTGARSALAIALKHDPQNAEASAELAKLNAAAADPQVRKPVQSTRPAQNRRSVESEPEENGYDRWRRGAYDGEAGQSVSDERGSDAEENHSGKVKVRRAKVGLLAGGAVMLGLSYLASAIVGLVSLSGVNGSGGCSTRIGFSLIPIFGNYIALGSVVTSSCYSGTNNQYESLFAGAVAAIVLGVLQDVGLTLLIVGASSKTTEWVPREEAISWDFSPVGPGGMPGASFTLRF